MVFQTSKALFQVEPPAEIPWDVGRLATEITIETTRKSAKVFCMTSSL